MKFQRNAVLYLQSVSMGALAKGAFGVIQGLYILSLGFSEAVLGTILSARMLSAAVFSIPAGMFSDRMGRRPVLIAAGLLTTVGYLGMAIASSSGLMVVFSCILELVRTASTRAVWNLLFYNVLIGFGAGMVIPYFNVFLTRKLGVTSDLVGLILSLSQGATAVAGLIAPILATRYGRVATVVGTQLASIPFLLLIALPPNVPDWHKGHVDARQLCTC